MNNPELDAVDDDLRKYYTDNFMTEYVAGVPIKIQIVRLLRKLLDQGDDGENCSRNGEDAKNDVQPEKLHGQCGSGLLVTVDRLAKLLGNNGDQRALDLLVELRSDLSVIAKSLHDLACGHVNVSAGIRLAHGVDAGDWTNVKNQAREPSVPNTTQTP